MISNPTTIYVIQGHCPLKTKKKRIRKKWAKKHTIAIYKDCTIDSISFSTLSNLVLDPSNITINFTYNETK